jgi:hypothetical protein
METKGKYYIGRLFDNATGKTTPDALLYDPADLTTHAVVVGMTGSGKTGLCIGLLEEAALNNIPALLIDPKGDITNLLLHFPELLPQDFQPWVNPDEARRAGQTIEQAAEATAAMWKKGLADWGIDPARIQALKDSARFTVYTPGSDAGIPVSILASFQAPAIPWEENREMLREKISGTVTALLTLVGMTDIDPVRSREHILISNIFENAWSQGQNLDLGELIMQVQQPPFEKLGVFDVNRFFPEKDRFELAMLLNNILAAPAFQAWIEGEPLDIQSLLYERDGRPRHSVFYIAHLSDQERMFFITLLYSAVESWMRSQPGTTTLRAIVYFDEIFGYMPPLQNPPSKQILLRLLKQARAFGMGQVLVTQNPVDVDYKALSNAGTWIIGKLQTDQDKQRLLDGLQGAVSGSLDRSTYDKMLSSLGKRVFLIHNVHAKGPQLFQTRWAMNYLAGPLTRNQIPALNELAGTVETPAKPAPTAGPAKPVLGAAGTVAATAAVTAAAVIPSTSPAPGRPAVAKPASSAAASSFSVSRSPLPTGIAEYFLPNNLSLSEAFKSAGREYPKQTASQGLIYRPVLVVQTTTRVFNRRYNLDYEDKRGAIVADPDRRGMVRWEDYPLQALDEKQFDRKPDPQARFATLDAPLSDVKIMNAIGKDFVDWAFRSGEVVVKANEELKVYAGPDVNQAEFRTRCSEAAKDSLDAETAKVTDTYEKQIAAIQDKIDREQRELDQDEAMYNQRKMDELGAGLDTVMGLFGGRKRSVSKNLTKRRMTSTARADVEESKNAILDYQKRIAALEKEKDQAIKDVAARWGEIASKSTEIKIAPLKKDVLLDFFGVAWFPYYLVQVDNETAELPGFAVL